MEQGTMLKKDGVRLVRKRLKEFLNPLGFQAHSTNCLVRAREHFIDEIQLDTGGYHLDPLYHIYYRPAPFTRLYHDKGRLWRAAQREISTLLYWSCKIPPTGGPYYYETEHFEAAWRDVAHVLEHYLLPHMEAMTPASFFSLLLKDSQKESDLFRPQNIIPLNDPGWLGSPEAAVYGVGMWRMGRYGEGVPYIMHAQKHYRSYIRLYTQEGETVSPQVKRTLRSLDRLMFLWRRQEEDWASAAQELIDQIADDWESYLF